MFTFSFSSAFADTQYTLNDYATALTAEKTAQLGYMNSAKNQAINGLEFNEDGFYGDYMKAAYEAAADAVIDDAEKLMKQAIDEVLNGKFPTPDAPDKGIVSKAYESLGDITTASVMKTEMLKRTDVLNKTQAPLTKAFVEGKIAVDLTKYNSTDKAYDKDTYDAGTDLTAAQAVQKIVDEAKTAIATAAKEKDDADKIKGYNEAYKKFEGNIAKIKTLADEEFADNINAGTVEAAVEQYAKDVLDILGAKGYGLLYIDPDMNATETIDTWGTLVSADLKAFWEESKTDTKKGELFGVAIANINKVTRTEAAAVNAAYKAAVAAAKAPVKAYANGDVKKLTGLTDAEKLTILANAMGAVEKYNDVKAEGEKMKAAYLAGIKLYDDAKVDQAVKAAEQLVYDDLDDELEDAYYYIQAAAKAEGIDLAAENFEIQKFENAIEDAAKKMYKDGTDATEVQVKVSYGDNKTADADLVYLQETYYNKEAWEKVADEVIEKLKDAQSYAEIDEIMADAAKEFGKLLKADDYDDVTKAIESYTNALASYAVLRASLLDVDMEDSSDELGQVLLVACGQGVALIEDAITVDGVKAAFEDAKAIIDKINDKSVDELKAAKEAVEKQIAALPYTSKLTVADKAAVKAAFEAYDAYMNMPGAKDIETASKKLLQEKYDKVNQLEADAIDAEAKAINDKLDKLGFSDADVAAAAALKAEADAVTAKRDALNDEIDAVNEDHEEFLKAVVFDEADELAGVDFDEVLVRDAALKIIKAAQDGATVEEMREALAAYNALTDRQKYQLDMNTLQHIKTIEGRLTENAKAYVQDLKIAARSVKTSKGVKVTIKADVQPLLDAGFTVEYKFYRSTKSNTKFGTAKVTKTENTYLNTSGKKGTRYYYKAKLVVKNAAGEVVATTPLTQCLYATRVF